MTMLKYYYSSMNSGKSTNLLQTAYNHKENGHNVLYFTSALDNRYGIGKITSRIGISSDAIIIQKNDLTVLQKYYNIIEQERNVHSIYVDECQFLNAEQVDFLSDFVDNLDVTVYCYGIRTDFESKLFDGSMRLFELADEITELSNICSCGNKSTMNTRITDSTEKVLIGGNETYISMCRKCYKKYMRNKNGTSN